MRGEEWRIDTVQEDVSYSNYVNLECDCGETAVARVLLKLRQPTRTCTADSALEGLEKRLTLCIHKRFTGPLDVQFDRRRLVARYDVVEAVSHDKVATMSKIWLTAAKGSLTHSVHLHSAWMLKLLLLLLLLLFLQKKKKLHKKSSKSNSSLAIPPHQKRHTRRWLQGLTIARDLTWNLSYEQQQTGSATIRVNLHRTNCRRFEDADTLAQSVFRYVRRRAVVWSMLRQTNREELPACHALSSLDVPKLDTDQA